MIIAKDADEDVTAAANAPGYPFFFIAGIRIDPNAATSATADPEISAKNIEVAILIMLRPPLINPTSAEAKAINLLDMPALFIIEPARINNGIAIKGNFIDPSNNTIAVSIKKLVPVFKTIAIIVVTANPIAIGTFIDRRNNKTANMVRIIIKYLLSAQYLLIVKPNFYNLLGFLNFQTT
tara:strand:- start:62 stop:601 length:540 start_codon:yes stop_codon:yes gene_type:complete